MMMWLRSFAFMVAFYGWGSLCTIFFLPLLALPRAYTIKGVKFWIKGIIWIQSHILGLRFKVTGIRNLPPSPYIVASKHQSAWETFVFHALLPDPAIVLKKELMWIPLFGWHLKKAGMIPLSRAKRKGTKSLKQLLQKADKALQNNQQILIFPEGTRALPGAPSTYQSGIASLYLHLKLPVVPVALNSGLYWPRRHFLKYPGCITVAFLKPIYPGLSRHDFMVKLQDEIEKATSTLLEEEPPHAKYP